MTSFYQVGNMRRKSVQPGIQYAVGDVWAAACAAQRINGEYLKEDKININEDGSHETIKKRNRDVTLYAYLEPLQMKIAPLVTSAVSSCKMILPSGHSRASSQTLIKV